jgi:hypothetical protein
MDQKKYNHNVIKQFLPKEDLKNFLVFENIFQSGGRLIVSYRAPFSESITISLTDYNLAFRTWERNQKIEEILQPEPGHYCPHCGQKNMLINDHFSHIELFHPDKSLI